MSTNCLVTKLKGSVNNDNLPILGKIVYKLDSQESPTINTTFFRIMAGTDPVDIEVRGTTLTDYSNMIQIDQTHYRIPLNSIATGHFNGAVDGYFIIDAYSPVYIQVIGGFESSKQSCIGLGSAKYGKLRGGNFSCNDCGDLGQFSNFRGLQTPEGGYVEQYEDSISKLVQSSPDLQFYKGINLDASVFSNCTSLSNISHFKGNIGNLPPSVRSTWISSSLVTGHLGDLIQKFRTVQTSGKAKFDWISSSRQVTMDDDNGDIVSCREWATSHNVQIGVQEVYVTWNADSYALTTDATGCDPYTTSITDVDYITD